MPVFKKIMGAVLFLINFGVAQATVKVYTRWNCAGEGYSLDFRNENYKNLHFTYDCDIEVGQYGNTRRGTCTGNFNDNVESVEITEDEWVIFFEHSKFHGAREDHAGNGCFNLDILADRASSSVVRSQ